MKVIENESLCYFFFSFFHFLIPLMSVVDGIITEKEKFEQVKLFSWSQFSPIRLSVSVSVCPQLWSWIWWRSLGCRSWSNAKDRGISHRGFWTTLPWIHILSQQPTPAEPSWCPSSCWTTWFWRSVVLSCHPGCVSETLTSDQTQLQWFKCRRWISQFKTRIFKIKATKWKVWPQSIKLYSHTIVNTNPVQVKVINK